jgi:uncharacterized damage-inducible protein DinB
MAAPQQGPSKEFAAAYRDMMVQNLLQEMATTKKVLAAVPDNKRDYRPDPKARTAGELAWHVASVDVQFLEEIPEGKFTMEPRFKEQPKTSAELADWYEKNFTRAMERVKTMTPEQLVTVLNFYDAFHFPAYVYLSFLEKHSIHHRGQLSAYLRPMGAKCPSIYGGSADEPWQGSAAAD